MVREVWERIWGRRQGYASHPLAQPRLKRCLDTFLPLIWALSLSPTGPLGRSWFRLEQDTEGTGSN